jgi:two-component system, cell cycle response regulator DivK
VSLASLNARGTELEPPFSLVVASHAQAGTEYHPYQTRTPVLIGQGSLGSLGLFEQEPVFGTLARTSQGILKWNRFLPMPITILIAEDYDDNRELLRVLLTSANYQVREAKNGYECVVSARENPPDLIMVDLSMPELDGWQVFSTLKADPTTAHIPCVAVTAHTVKDCERALQSGFSAFVGKPFRTEELLETVARLVSGVESAVK